jgi:hypothetical protein
MTSDSLTLTLLPETFAVCRLAPDAPVPEPPAGGSLYSWTRTATESSVICVEGEAPESDDREGDWRALVVDGPLPFEAVGILAALAGALAAAEVSLFALSTFDTDYLLVKQESLDTAIATLRHRGNTVHRVD